MTTTLYAATDGLVVTHRIKAARVNPHVAWCDIVRDALIERRWEDVNRMIEKHDDDELTMLHDKDHYVLPIYEAATSGIARKIIVRFCKMGVGAHPLLAPRDRWYYLPNFESTAKELFRWSVRFEQFAKDLS